MMIMMMMYYLAKLYKSVSCNKKDVNISKMQYVDYIINTKIFEIAAVVDV